MLINASSGIIYPETDINSGLSNDLTSLAAGGVLYGQNGDSSVKNSQQTSVFDAQQIKSGNNVVDNSNNSKNIVFGGDQNKPNIKSDTSIHQTDSFQQDEEIERKLEEYRKQINKWKGQKKKTNLLNSFGLDMNNEKDNKNILIKENKDKVDWLEEYHQKQEENRKNYVKSDNQSLNSNNSKYSSKNHEIDRKLDFEPLSYKKQIQRIESRNNKDNIQKNGQQAEKRANSGLTGFLRTRDRNTDNNEEKSEKKQKNVEKKPSKAGKAVKNATKASIKTSGTVTAKGLMAAWGLGSFMIKQDIFFRLIIGLFIGVAFVSLVLVGR